MRHLTLLVTVSACTALTAQNVFHGNGIPSAYVENTPAIVDQAVSFRLGSPTAPNGLAVLSLSGGFGPVNLPGLGLVGLDPFHPFYATILRFLDANGDSSVTLSIPTGFATAATPPFYANTLSVEAAFALSFSKTVRVEWANANGWEPVAALGAPRQMHSATPLGSGPRDNVTEILICGGATGSIIVPAPMSSAELYDPMTRSLQPLPSMTVARAMHRAVCLADGRVLVTGGATTGGVVTATCEFFDPATMTFTPAPPMLGQRVGHALTLLADGRVLASGGFSDWQNAAVNFVVALNTAVDTAELFDPVTNTWTALPNMASKRAGHSQTLLPDGRVLVVSGINGGQFVSGGTVLGQVPVFTQSCQLFDPATATFAATADLVVPVPPFGLPTTASSGFHGASLLPNGSVLITGGFIGSNGWGGGSVPTAVCAVWAANAWTATAPLPAPVAWHSQVPYRGGALVAGGFVGDLTQLQTTSDCGMHDGVTYTVLAPIGTDAGGTAQPRAAHTCTPMYDGTFLVYGGGLWPATLGDGFVYTGQ